MKFFIAILTICISLNAKAKFPTIKGLKKTYSATDLAKMNQGKVLSSYSLINWNQWQKQPGVFLLEPNDNYRPPEDLFIFHSRSYFIVNKAPSSFTAQQFLNLSFLQQLEPGNTHKQSSCANLCLTTKIPFPEEWAEEIEDLKAIGKLSEKNTVYLEVDNEYVFSNQIDAKNRKAIKKLMPVKESIVAVMGQRSKSINQMFQFLGSIIAIHDLGGKSLVIVDAAVGIEKDLDDKVNGSTGKQILIALLSQRDPRTLIPNILLGKDSDYNSAKTGVGSGLPKYSNSLAERAKALMEKM